MQMITFTPLRIPLGLASGVMENSVELRRWLEESLEGQVEPQGTRFHLEPVSDGEAANQGRDGATYEALDRDYMDSRLLVCRFKGRRVTGKLHVFPDEVAVAEVSLGHVPSRFLEFPAAKARDALSAWSQRHSRRLVQCVYRQCLAPAIDRLRGSRGASRYLDMNANRSWLDKILGRAGDARDRGPELGWVGRALLMSEGERRDPRWESLIREWLKLTLRPRDAEEIISGDRHIAMRWLNYLLVDRGQDDLKCAASAMCLAQFFYMAQESANRELYHQMSEAFRAADTRSLANRLRRIEEQNRYRIIRYHELRRYLMRRKKELLDEILAGWDFGDLLANTERMLEMNRSRVLQITRRRGDRGTLLTDLILAGVTIVLLMELVLFALQYSREVMLHPTLSYRDQAASWVLAHVAGIDMDSVILGALAFILVLLGLYVIAKLR